MQVLQTFKATKAFKIEVRSSNYSGLDAFRLRGHTVLSQNK